MGPRLVYRLDLPPALEPLAIPTKLLLQLVENAVKHGLEPLACGGSVEVAARRTDAGVVITVADAALGLPPYRPHAMVASNNGELRRDAERWRVIYGRSAMVALTSRHSTGMCAKVTLC
jgi:LytS/YehU family sensor histidine kinase